MLELIAGLMRQAATDVREKGRWRLAA